MSVLLYNFVFLGIIAVVYVVGLFGGMFRMNRLAQSLGDAAQELEDRDYAVTYSGGGTSESEDSSLVIYTP